MHPEVLTNGDSRISAHELGRKIPEYRKTYDFAGRFIDDYHAWWNSCPTTGVKVGRRPRPTRAESLADPQYDIRDVPGSLRRADALKLYELAYFCGGNAIDLGTSFGLSCSIMAGAMEHARSAGCIDTVDVDPHSQKLARISVGRLPGAARVKFHLGDAGQFLADYAGGGRQAAFVFVDHAHSYERVLEAARLMNAVVAPGGFVLFHDYNDWRNSDPDDPAFADLWRGLPSGQDIGANRYGVYQAAHEGLSPQFQFHGAFGCTGLFRRMRS